ncbi:MAG: glycine-rich domain-containing protein, partial [Bacteroidota bacterium]
MSKELWQKICDFDFDDPAGGNYTFTIRLAKENYWSKNFTELAVLEYKKFMYLAAIADQIVSPSEIVDVVWHQHLVYTNSYNDFCKLAGK